MTEAVQLKVTGMKCGGCESNVTGKLKAVAGVSVISASAKEGQVAVEFDPAQTDLAIIKKTITDAGFTVE